MFDELRNLFISALVLEGEGAGLLVQKWNKEIARLQEIYDGLTDKVSVAGLRSAVFGKWEDTADSYADTETLKDWQRQTCKCSRCGMTSERPVGYFCKWCGADMRGGEDG